jgi:hypothetical protein
METFIALISVTSFTALFSILDRALTYKGFQGVYYIVHAVHNAFIVVTTVPDLYHTFTDLHHIDIYPPNYLAIQLCFALHLYHIALYYPKFRYDDWLHHILMVGLGLPIGCIESAHTFTGLSLFFTTGLPGGIDYALLALNRNGQIARNTEKTINTFLNVWIRSPGCCGMAALGIANILSNPDKTSIIAMVPCILNYWNGQYFMKQVVEDYANLNR